MPEMDYQKLRGRITERNMTQKSLARAIGTSEGQLCQKMAGRYPFKQSEIRNICDVLGIQQGDIGFYFFTPKVEKS